MMGEEEPEDALKVTGRGQQGDWQIPKEVTETCLIM